jgi:hypothetical protein
MINKIKALLGVANEQPRIMKVIAKSGDSLTLSANGITIESIGAYQVGDEVVVSGGNIIRLAPPKMVLCSR